MLLLVFFEKTNKEERLYRRQLQVAIFGTDNSSSSSAYIVKRRLLIASAVTTTIIAYSPAVHNFAVLCAVRKRWIAIIVKCCPTALHELTGYQQILFFHNTSPFYIHAV